MARRKKFFRTRREANTYFKANYNAEFERTQSLDVAVRKFKYAVGGYKFFVGDRVEYDCVRFS